MGSLEGKVAFITGAARGQGRSHALALAAQGADIIAVDICHDLDGIPYPLATPEDLADTVRGVEALDRRCIATQADTRDLPALQAAFDRGVAKFGGCDIVVANAAVAAMDATEPDPITRYHLVIDINLTGTWHTVRVATPTLVAQGRGGSIIIISSTSGLRGNMPPVAAGEAYTAAKHGIVGLARNFANTLAEHSIRVNTIHPTGVATPMIMNEAFARIVEQKPHMLEGMSNLLPVEMLQPEDVSDSVVFLASDAAKYITGIALPVDAGYSNKK
jgi:SDR family mycofactocin-dependent oxidoreductase